MTSPTKNTLQRCRKHGWMAQVVEHWVPATKRRRDLFGVIDVVAVRPGSTGVLGIQASSRSNLSGRKAKAQCDEIRTWLEAGNQFELWMWDKAPMVRKDGTKGALRWRLLRRTLSWSEHHEGWWWDTVEP